MRRTDFIHYADTDKPVLLINHDIGFDPACPEVDYIDGDDFVDALLRLDNAGKKVIEVWICSNGGYVSDGQKMYMAILASKAKVNTVCTGVAASIAAVIFCAGRERTILDYAKLMFHNPHGGKQDKGMDAIRDSIIKMISGRCGLSEAKVASMMDKTTWMDAEEAKTYMIATKIDNVADKNIKNALNGEGDEMMKAQLEFTNKLLIKNKNTMFTKEDAKALGLPEDASQELIGSVMRATSLNAIKNKKEKNDDDGDDDGMEDKKNAKDEAGSLKPVIKEMTKKHDKLRADHEALKGDHEELQGKFEDLCDKFSTMQDKFKNMNEEKDHKEMEVRKNSMSIHIKNAMEEKNIVFKAEDVKNFVDSAAKSQEMFENTKSIIDAIPAVAKESETKFVSLEQTLIENKDKEGNVISSKVVITPKNSSTKEEIDAVTKLVQQRAAKSNFGKKGENKV